MWSWKIKNVSKNCFQEQSNSSAILPLNICLKYGQTLSSSFQRSRLHDTALITLRYKSRQPQIEFDLTQSNRGKQFRQRFNNKSNETFSVALDICTKSFSCNSRAMVEGYVLTMFKFFYVRPNPQQYLNIWVRNQGENFFPAKIDGHRKGATFRFVLDRKGEKNIKIFIGLNILSIRTRRVSSGGVKLEKYFKCRWDVKIYAEQRVWVASFHFAAWGRGKLFSLDTLH